MSDALRLILQIRSLNALTVWFVTTGLSSESRRYTHHSHSSTLDQTNAAGSKQNHVSWQPDGQTYGICKDGEELNKTRTCSWMVSNYTSGRRRQWHYNVTSGIELICRYRDSNQSADWLTVSLQTHSIHHAQQRTGHVILTPLHTHFNTCPHRIRIH
jgi:hypothetical protein